MKVFDLVSCAVENHRSVGEDAIHIEHKQSDVTRVSRHARSPSFLDEFHRDEILHVEDADRLAVARDHGNLILPCLADQLNGVVSDRGVQQRPWIARHRVADRSIERSPISDHEPPEVTVREDPRQSSTLIHDQNRAGPTLYRLFGREAGAVEDYKYSDALRHMDVVWTDETVSRLFEVGPDEFVPGTKMPMQRIPDADDRRALMSYLKRITEPSN